jgi:hypothetical protein
MIWKEIGSNFDGITLGKFVAMMIPNFLAMIEGILDYVL